MKALEFLVSVDCQAHHGQRWLGSVPADSRGGRGQEMRCKEPRAITRSARPKRCFFCKHDVRRKRCYPKKCSEMPNLITPWHMLRRLFGFSSQKNAVDRLWSLSFKDKSMIIYGTQLCQVVPIHHDQSLAMEVADVDTFMSAGGFAQARSHQSRQPCKLVTLDGLFFFYIVYSRR